jgi:hypothetical protein
MKEWKGQKTKKLRSGRQRSGDQRRRAISVAVTYNYLIIAVSRESREFYTGTCGREVSIPI